MPAISAPALRRFASALLTGGGFADQDADAMADLLVWANLRGADSHGVLRIPRYIEMLALGQVKADHQISIVQAFGAIRVVDGDMAPGAVAMNRAVKEAMTMATGFGLGWCGARRTSHAGAVGYFVEQIARAGMIGIAMTASKPLMSYFGAKGEALSTNPLAISVPAPDGGDPLILDMSTAAVALGKVMSAKDANRPIPLGWAIDAEGAETTDPHKVAALLPMAGAKGSGLSLMIEMLCSVLNGNPAIAPALTGGKGGGFNGMVLAVDPRAFGDPQAFREDVGALMAAIGGLEPASGFDRVRLPGERGYETRRLRERDGIALASGTVDRLIDCARGLGVELPAGLAE
jgi:ureidoglycolate dehydrogenase (NAD+)